MRRVLFILFLFLTTLSLNAQDAVRGDVRRGNNHFRKDRYKEADIDYRKALVKDSTSFAANYNLANTLYKMSSKDAGTYYGKIKDAALTSGHAADYYYNVGNNALAEKNYQAAVDAFKQSLILNPGDIDAKENYLYAKQLLDDQNNQNQNQNQNNQNQNNQNQNNQNDQNQDNQDNQDNQNNNQDQNKDNQDQNQDQNQGDDNQDQNNQNEGNGQPQMNQQTAQQMLQAIQAKEKDTQDKVNKEKAAAFKSRQKEKNW